MNDFVEIYTDGSYREVKGKTTLSGYGFSAYEKNKEKEVFSDYGEVYNRYFIELEAVGAEFVAIIKAIKWAISNHYERVLLKTDHNVSYDMLQPDFKVKRSKKKGYRMFYEQMSALRNKIDVDVELIHKQEIKNTQVFERHLVAHNLSRKMIFIEQQRGTSDKPTQKRFLKKKNKAMKHKQKVFAALFQSDAAYGQKGNDIWLVYKFEHQSIFRLKKVKHHTLLDTLSEYLPISSEAVLLHALLKELKKKDVSTFKIMTKYKFWLKHTEYQPLYIKQNHLNRHYSTYQPFQLALQTLQEFEQKQKIKFSLNIEQVHRFEHQAYLFLQKNLGRKASIRII